MGAVFNRPVHALTAWFGRTFSRWDAVLVSLVLASAIVSFWPDPTAADHVHADSWAYIIPSLNFLHGKGFVVIANAHKYPPAPCFGLSLLLSAVYTTLGHDVGNGAYLIFLFGLATVLLAYFMARMLFDRRVAVVACVLLIVASQFRFYAKVIAPDGAVTAFFCLASQILLFAALRNPQSSLWIWALLGNVLGFALAVRPDNLLLLLPTAALLLLHLNNLNRAWAKVAILSSGVLFWGMVILLANFLCTGDWSRTGYAVNFSAQHDRLGGIVSWRYFLIPSFRESNFVKLLRDAPDQWSLFGADADRARSYFYYAADALLLVGLVQVLKASKSETQKRDLLIWASIWLVSLVLFFSCFFFPVDARYLQRTVPYLCLFTAVGFVACWDFVAGLGMSHGLPRLSGLVWTLRLLFVVGFSGAGLHMLVHPHVGLFARLHQSAYLRHVNDVIPEKDAMILTDWNLPWMEYFVAQDTQRTIIPFNPFDSGADSYIQWKRPPHPEWINEDCPNSDSKATVRYRHMYENGAEDIYPYTVWTTPGVISLALRSGKSVYLVMRGCYTNMDKDTLILLLYRYNLELVERGWAFKHESDEEFTDITSGFAIAKIVPKSTFGMRIHNTAEKLVLLESENGVAFGFPGHAEQSAGDNTKFTIVWGDERHFEQTLQFKSDGRVLTIP